MIVRQDVFRDPAPLYNNAIRDSGYTNDVECLERRNNNEPFSKRKCARKVTCFNPPFNKHVLTKVVQKFLKLVNKLFPVGYKLQKVSNRNTVKVSYSCMPV